MIKEHPILTAHGSFADHVKLGRKPKREDHRTLELAKYLKKDVVLPTIPASCDYTKDVTEWPMYGNDSMGDCTCAAAGHMIQGWSAAAGAAKTPADNDVITLYAETGDPPSSTITPGSPQDDGRDEMSVLNFWRQNGLGTDKIEAYVSVDPSDEQMVKAAIYLFGGVYTGIALPITAQSQSVWDVVDAPPDQNEPGTWGGHAVPYLAFDGTSYTCITWGHPLQLTKAFHAEYTDEVYAVLSSDFLAANSLSPDGFDLNALRADLLEVSSN
ncbi:MAG TPA: hypothetical protein VN039_07065 [Nitrospira sp.]|nr:hypothetical protein [Nitrospira sp.]